MNFTSTFKIYSLKKSTENPKSFFIMWVYLSIFLVLKIYLYSPKNNDEKKYIEINIKNLK